MNTKLVMILSAIIMAVIGISASFIPHEILTFIELPAVNPAPLLIQIMGAMYFSFAMINWFAKSNVIGGIYGKPIAIGNFTHFSISSLALIKGVNIDTSSAIILVATLIYLIFAILFGYIAFGNPIKRDDA
jgi:hypothetical protein